MCVEIAVLDDCGEALYRINRRTGRKERVERSVWQKIRDADIANKRRLPLPENDERVPWEEILEELIDEGSR